MSRLHGWGLGLLPSRKRAASAQRRAGLEAGVQAARRPVGAEGDGDGPLGALVLDAGLGGSGGEDRVGTKGRRGGARWWRHWGVVAVLVLVLSGGLLSFVFAKFTHV